MPHARGPLRRDARNFDAWEERAALRVLGRGRRGPVFAKGVVGLPLSENRTRDTRGHARALPASHPADEWRSHAEMFLRGTVENASRVYLSLSLGVA